MHQNHHSLMVTFWQLQMMILIASSGTSPSHAVAFQLFHYRNKAVQPGTTIQPYWRGLFTRPTTSTALQDRREKEEETERNFGVLVSLDRTDELVSQPEPDVPGRALIFPPLTLLALMALFPLFQVILTVILFAALRTAAFKLIVFEETADEDSFGVALIDIDSKLTAEEDEEESWPPLSLQIDAATLILSVFAAGLLTPDKIDTNLENSWTILPVVALAGAALLLSRLFNGAVAQVLSEEKLTLQDKLLNRWDQRLQQQTKANKTKKDK